MLASCESPINQNELAGHFYVVQFSVILVVLRARSNETMNTIVLSGQIDFFISPSTCDAVNDSPDPINVSPDHPIAL